MSSPPGSPPSAAPPGPFPLHASPPPHPRGPDAGSVVGEDRLPGEPLEEPPAELLHELRSY